MSKTEHIPAKLVPLGIKDDKAQFGIKPEGPVEYRPGDRVQHRHYWDDGTAEIIIKRAGWLRRRLAILRARVFKENELKQTGRGHL